LAAKTIETKVILHFIVKGCYKKREVLFENINKVKNARIPLVMNGIFFVLTVFERNRPGDIDPSSLKGGTETYQSQSSDG
jgi:hypothetical protein